MRKILKRTLEEIGNVLELRDVVLSISAILNQQLKGVVELLASMAGIQIGELFEDDSPSMKKQMSFQISELTACTAKTLPSGGLLFGVADLRDRLTTETNKQDARSGE